VVVLGLLLVVVVQVLLVHQTQAIVLVVLVEQAPHG
jgi:hypothetical protein